ncbi:AGAP000133-PA [Anopheles gambiae str. PEST]|uniref:AGAP000133-PA n=1 Tax=Anopheles gambiae TaxID=7165 RepID=Q7PFW6_ANOGA|nr:AGAP000133-PA [Anopheles gambiae str. PEST]
MQSNSTETVIVTMDIKPKSRPWPVAPKKTIRLRIPGPRGKCFTNRLEWQERMAAKQIKPRPRRKDFRIKEQANMHNSIIQYIRDNAESDESDDDSGTLIPGNDVLNSSIASINISGSQKEIGHNSGEAINEIRDCESEPHNQHHAITTASLNPEHAIYTEPGVTGVLTQRRGKSTESVQVRHQNDGPPVPAL